MRLLISAILAAIATVLMAAALGAAQPQSIWAPPPLSEATKPPTRPTAATAARPRSAAAGVVKLVLPEASKAIRGILEVNAAGVEQGGYVIFRIDREFAYATTAPFRMRWDTAGAEDGMHIIQVAGFSAERAQLGTASAMVRIQNQVLGAVPPEGLALEVRIREGQTIVRNVEGESSIAGLGLQAGLPKNLQGLQGRLFARFSQSAVEINPVDNSAIVRTNVRMGLLTTDQAETELQEKGHYGMVTMRSTGLEMPPSPESRRPRIGLGEISLDLPTGPLHEGMSWVSPMRVVADLVERGSYEVQGTHTFEGVWWLKGRKCARISSLYEIGEILITGSGAAQTAGLPEQGFALEHTGGVGMGVFMQRSGQTGAAPRTGTAGAGLPTAPRVNRPGTTPTPAPEATLYARLTGLSGFRATWIDIERKVVVRTEDHITGTLVLQSATGETVPGFPVGAVGGAASFAAAGEPYALALTGGVGRPGGGGSPGARTGASSAARTGTTGGRSPLRRLVPLRPEEEDTGVTLQRLPYSLDLMIDLVS